MSDRPPGGSVAEMEVEMIETLPHGGLTEDRRWVFADWTAETVRENAVAAAARAYLAPNDSQSGEVPGDWTMTPDEYVTFDLLPAEVVEQILRAMRSASRSAPNPQTAYIMRTVAHIFQVLALPWGSEQARKALAHCILIEGLRNHGYVQSKPRVGQEWLLFATEDYFEKGPDWLVRQLIEEYGLEQSPGCG